MLNARTPAALSIKMQAATRLKFEAVKQVAVPDIALAATSGKRRGAVDQTLLVDADHAHLLHGVDESDVPGSLAETEGRKRSRSNWVLSYVLVGGKREWCLASFCLGVVLLSQVPTVESSSGDASGLVMRCLATVWAPRRAARSTGEKPLDPGDVVSVD
jgi:hypothetical protein